ncbi:hydrogenase subunit MbhD domain-containing protein [Saccharospirillum sp.]|uniref:hydrogenase subunit MbhD domain-containing protein n=1 Tax=Saccharospirillum sp. TaxID=2033801 RepID=UPI0034A095E5
MTADGFFDALLAMLIVSLACGALYSRSLYRAVVFFIALGLSLALVWARLSAPDLALAEAAIGAGLTGVLLLSALKHQAAEPLRPMRPSFQLLMAVLTGVTFLLVLTTVWSMPAGMAQVGQLALNSVNDSGVEHPITAVLLNFRAWDTLLELLVVVLALLGVRQLKLPNDRLPVAWPLLLAWSKLLAPLSLLLGVYLLWRGADAPGGAFQAGALIGSGLLMLKLVGLAPTTPWSHWGIRLLVLLGSFTFLLVAMATDVFGAGWLTYPPGWNKALILLIEVAATASIALSLAMLAGSDHRELNQ